MRALIRGLLWVIGLLAIIAGGLRLTVIRHWSIPEDPVLGLSMAPSLTAGDVVLLWTRGTRRFGELVRCRDPEDPQRWVVGRIIGLEGDTVEVESGVAIVNGSRYNVTDTCQKSTVFLTDAKGNQFEGTCSRVEMAGGWHYRATISGQSVESRTSHEVGPGRVFLLSDNRTLHDDSRDFGALEASTCTEQIVFRLWQKEGFFASAERFDYVR